MKVSENVEKGGAVLKMVSSSTGFLKGMMELSLAGSASNITSSHLGKVNDGSTVSSETNDNDATPTSRPANGPGLVQSSVAGGGDSTVSRRFGKGVAWLQRRCRRSGALPSSGEQADRYWWHRRSASTDAATHVCPTAAPEAVPSSVSIVDRSTVSDKKQERTSLVRGNNNDRQDSAVGGVYEKRTKWLKRCGRIADTDDCCADVVNDENGTAASSFSSHCQSDALSSTEKLGVAISVISDGQSNGVDIPGKVNDSFVVGEPGSIDRDARLNDHGDRVEAEVVLDPAALSTTTTPLMTNDQSHDHRNFTAVDQIPSVTTAHPPAWQARDSDVDYSPENSIHDVASGQRSPITQGPLGSSTTDHTEYFEPKPLSSDVDFLCSEIGRLVADYMRQHLVFLRFIFLKSMQNTLLNHDRLIIKCM